MNGKDEKTIAEKTVSGKKTTVENGNIMEKCLCAAEEETGRAYGCVWRQYSTTGNGRKKKYRKK